MQSGTDADNGYIVYNQTTYEKASDQGKPCPTDPCDPGKGGSAPGKTLTLTAKRVRTESSGLNSGLIALFNVFTMSSADFKKDQTDENTKGESMTAGKDDYGVGQKVLGWFCATTERKKDWFTKIERTETGEIKSKRRYDREAKNTTWSPLTRTIVYTQSYDPCTGELSGDLCPKLPKQPCEAEPVDEGSALAFD